MERRRAVRRRAWPGPDRRPGAASRGFIRWSRSAAYCEYIVDFLPGLSHDGQVVCGVAYLHNATEYGVAALRRSFPTPARRGCSRASGGLTSWTSCGLALRPTRQGLRTRMSSSALAVAPEQAVARRGCRGDPRPRAVRAAGRAAGGVQPRPARYRGGRAGDAKTVVIITGGPGTGKSVIALSLLGELARRGRTAVHATGSRSFTQTLRKVAGKGSGRTQRLFRYFNDFIAAERNGLEVLIARRGPPDQGDVGQPVHPGRAAHRTAAGGRADRGGPGSGVPAGRTSGRAAW